MVQKKPLASAMGGVLPLVLIALMASAVFAQDAPPPAEGEGESQAEGETTPPTEETPPAEEEPAQEPPKEPAAKAVAIDEEENKLDDVTVSEPRDHLVLKVNDEHDIILKVAGGYELHLVLDSADYSGNDWLSFFVLRLDANITKKDQISLRMDMEQRNVVDSGESMLWFGDMRFYYSRKFAIPIPDFPIPSKASIYITAPTSRQSIARSYITKPTASLTLAPSWGPMTLLVQTYFRYSIAKYAESSNNGDPNVRFTGGYAFQLVYAPLKWFAPSATWQQYWQQKYPTREGELQVSKPLYSFKFAANFGIPTPTEWPAIDMSLNYSQGASFIDDGVYRWHFMQRDHSQIFLGINFVY
ncbi:MAG: hypothetical protein GY847_02890 [Proteobacteria bacterium]|nr:hypothetical protein [Pseudomonadota bacterium]